LLGKGAHAPERAAPDEKRAGAVSGHGAGHGAQPCLLRRVQFGAHERLDVTEERFQLGVGSRGGELIRQLVWRPIIVSIQQRQPMAGGQPQARIPRRADPLIVLVHVLHLGTVGMYHSGAIVGGPVVNHDHLLRGP